MEIIELQGKLSEQSKQNDVGKRFEVLIEGESKKSKDEFFGRTSQNKVVVFPKGNHKIGEFVYVEVTSCTPAYPFRAYCRGIVLIHSFQHYHGKSRSPQGRHHVKGSRLQIPDSKLRITNYELRFFTFYFCLLTFNLILNLEP